MATFKEIRGQLIRKYTTNPTDPLEGQMWYNNTTGTLKGRIVSAAWSSSAPVVKQNYRFGSTGAQTAALIFGGSDYPFGGLYVDTYEYNGSGWSTGGDMAQGRWALRGAGTQTAGLGFGGYIGPPGPPTKNSALTEEYDGSAWTTGGAMGTGRYTFGGAGTQTSALAFGGFISPGPVGGAEAKTEAYNGTGWTAGEDLPSTRTRNTGCGPSDSDALSVGTLTSGVCSTYNGTSWTNTGNMGTARYRGGSSGNTSSAITYGGSTYPGVNNVAVTEDFDGSTWSSNPATMGTARYALGYSGSTTAALASAGYASGMTQVTEEYNATASVITAGAWASATAMGTARRNPAQGVGPPTAAMVTGGINGASAVGQTEQYNGSSWTEVPDLNTARQCMGSGNAGSQTAAIVFGGSTSEPMPGGLTDATEEFNGTSWTTTPNAMIAGRFQLGGCGTTAAALAFGGDPGTVDSSEEWDGTSWTEGSNLNTARQQVQGCGTQTAGLGVGGYNPPSGWLDSTEEYNGASWTVGGANLVSVGSMGMAGIQTAALSFGGSPGNPAVTTGYDGAAWSTRPSLGTGVDFNGGAGSSTAALSFGGNSPSPPTDNGITTVEEFTAETTSANIVTVTTS